MKNCNIHSCIYKTESVGTIESVKAVSEVYAPFDGKITEANSALSDEPELVNEEPYGEGRLI